MAIETSTNFKILDNMPIDTRFVVENESDLETLKAYEGLVVYVTSTKKQKIYLSSGWKDVEIDLSGYAKTSDIPQNTSDLTNNSGFITNAVNNLTNYYLKNDTYTKTEVNNLIGNITKVTIQSVDSLPTTGETNVIYLVPKADGTSPDIKEEYIYVNNSWELIGNTKVDLTNYALKSELNNYLPLSGGEMTGGITLGIGNGNGLMFPSDVVNGAQSSFGVYNTNDNGNYCTLVGFINGKFTLGHGSFPLNLRGSGTRPTYKENELSLYSDIPTDYIDTETEQTITGVKTFSNGIKLGDDNFSIKKRSDGSVIDIYVNDTVNPTVVFGRSTSAFGSSIRSNSTKTHSLGTADNQWKDLYIGGNLSDGTNEITVAQIVDKLNNINLSREQLVSTIGETTTSLSGLMSSTDKERLDTLVALLKDEDDNTIVDTIAEVLSIFNQYPEGADLVSVLAGKADKNSDNRFSAPQTIEGKLSIDTTDDTDMGIPAVNVLHTGPYGPDDFATLMVLSGKEGKPYGFKFRTHGSGTAIIQSERIGSTTEKFPLSLNPDGGNVLVNNKKVATVGDFKTINGESIVGTGDITLETGGGETRPLKEYVASGVTEKQLEPNKYYIFDSQVADGLVISFAEEDPIYLDEFIGEIKVDESPINVTFPNSIRWGENSNVTNNNNTLTLTEKCTYLFSVANNLGLIANIPNPSLAMPELTINGTILSWQPVENAQSYQLQRGYIPIDTTTQTSIDLSNYFTEIGEYVIIVTAKSNYYTDTSSAELYYYISMQLPTPSNLVLSDTGTLTWDSTGSDTIYEVYEMEGGTLLQTSIKNYIDLTTITGLSGTHTIKVKATHTLSNIYLDSEFSEGVSYTWE